MNNGKELSIFEDWETSVMRHDRLELLTGQLVKAQQVLIGIVLLEIGANYDIKKAHQALSFARVLKTLV